MRDYCLVYRLVQKTVAFCELLPVFLMLSLSPLAGERARMFVVSSANDRGQA